jgi:hypothetical protein
MHIAVWAVVDQHLIAWRDGDMMKKQSLIAGRVNATSVLQSSVAVKGNHRRHVPAKRKQRFVSRGNLLQCRADTPYTRHP